MEKFMAGHNTDSIPQTISPACKSSPTLPSCKGPKADHIPAQNATKMGQISSSSFVESFWLASGPLTKGQATDVANPGIG